MRGDERSADEALLLWHMKPLQNHPSERDLGRGIHNAMVRCTNLEVASVRPQGTTSLELGLTRPSAGRIDQIVLRDG